MDQELAFQLCPSQVYEPDSSADLSGPQLSSHHFEDWTIGICLPGTHSACSDNDSLIFLGNHSSAMLSPMIQVELDSNPGSREHRIQDLPITPLSIISSY